SATAGSFDYSVSDSNGLLLGNSKVGSRDVAEEFNLPYFDLVTNLVKIRGKLRADDNSGASPRSRLIDFSPVTLALENSNGATADGVQAVYTVDNFGSGSKACMIVVQRQAIGRPQAGCEPFEAEVCQQVGPSLEYEFFGRANEALESFTVPQRL